MKLVRFFRVGLRVSSLYPAPKGVHFVHYFYPLDSKAYSRLRRIGKPVHEGDVTAFNFGIRWRRVHVCASTYCIVIAKVCRIPFIQLE